MDKSEEKIENFELWSRMAIVRISMGSKVYRQPTISGHWTLRLCPHYGGLKTQQSFSDHATSEKFENKTITGHFGFVFEETSVREIAWLLTAFSRSSVFKTFSVHTKTKSRCFQIPPVWRAFTQSSVFVTDSGVDGRPNRRKKQRCAFKFLRPGQECKLELWLGSYISCYICLTQLKFSLIIKLGVLSCLNILFWSLDMLRNHFVKIY